MANGSLGDVVRRLDTLDVEEGPEGIGAREELLAGPCGLQMRRGYALGQQRLDAALDQTHVDAEGAVRERPIAHAVPPREHSRGLAKLRSAADAIAAFLAADDEENG